MHFKKCSIMLLSVVSCLILANNVHSEPQLDLPPINPDLRYNNFVSTNNPIALQGDTDRSQRYGPPYQEDKAANDAVDDYRLGQTYMYDERNRYGSNYPLSGVHNLTRDSPFSDRDNEVARFRNHNYENPRDGFQDRYADRFNGRTQQGRQNEENNDLNPYGNNQQNFNVNPNQYVPNRYDGQNYPNQPINPTSTPFPPRQYEPQNYPNPNPTPTPFPANRYESQNYPNSNANPYPSSTPFPPGQNTPQNFPNSANYPINSNQPYPNANQNPYSTPFPGQPQNPFVTPFPQNFRNEDRFNLNERENERDRFRQDRRFQIELERLRNFLVETDHKGSQECTANVAAQWNYETNVNDFTQAEAVSVN